MRRLTIYLLLLLAIPLVVAMPYATNRLLNLGSGPREAALYHQDGTVSHLVLDPRMKPPAWLHFPPGTSVADAAYTTWDNKPDVYGSFDFVVPMRLPDLKRYFMASLAAEGFAVSDLGLGTLNQQAADFMGVAGTITGARAATGEDVTVTFREEEGLFRKARQVQLGWHRVPTPAVGRER